ncbi:hypothetical protein M0R36_10140 [bacterium]|jgi:hypothetical protein|nr:hypothetical protein [bacterium]
MMDIIGKEKSNYPIKRLIEVRNKFGFYLKPFVDRENEEIRNRYLGIQNETKIILKKLNDILSKLKSLNYEYKKMQLSERIVNNLIFIAEKKFLSLQLRSDIKLIMKKLKTMSFNELEKQNKIIEEVKSKILENIRR